MFLKMVKVLNKKQPCIWPFCLSHNLIFPKAHVSQKWNKGKATILWISFSFRTFHLHLEDFYINHKMVRELTKHYIHVQELNQEMLFFVRSNAEVWKS